MMGAVAENRRSRRRGARRIGLTLAELLLTITIVAAMAALIVPNMTNRNENSRVAITAATLTEIQVALRNFASDNFEQLPFPVDATRQQYPQLAYLYLNPKTFLDDPSGTGTVKWTYDGVAKCGWSGPYLRQGGAFQSNPTLGYTVAYGRNGDPAPIDAWGQAIVLQQPVVNEGSSSRTSLRYARLVSAGCNGVIDTPPDVLVPTLKQTGDDLILTLGTAL